MVWILEAWFPGGISKTPSVLVLRSHPGKLKQGFSSIIQRGTLIHSQGDLGAYALEHGGCFTRETYILILQML